MSTEEQEYSGAQLPDLAKATEAQFKGMRDLLSYMTDSAVKNRKGLAEENASLRAAVASLQLDVQSSKREAAVLRRENEELRRENATISNRFAEHHRQMIAFGRLMEEKCSEFIGVEDRAETLFINQQTGVALEEPVTFPTQRFDHFRSVLGQNR